KPIGVLDPALSSARRRSRVPLPGLGSPVHPPKGHRMSNCQSAQERCQKLFEESCRPPVWRRRFQPLRHRKSPAMEDSVLCIESTGGTKNIRTPARELRFLRCQVLRGDYDISFAAVSMQPRSHKLYRSLGGCGIFQQKHHPTSWDSRGPDTPPIDSGIPPADSPDPIDAESFRQK